jgi:hypothetical protein
MGSFNPGIAHYGAVAIIPSFYGLFDGLFICPLILTIRIQQVVYTPVSFPFLRHLHGIF